MVAYHAFSTGPVIEVLALDHTCTASYGEYLSSTVGRRGEPQVWGIKAFGQPWNLLSNTPFSVSPSSACVNFKSDSTTRVYEALCWSSDGLEVAG